jgi:phosphate uptake regulator
MKRKVIQIGNSTQLISLPRAWAKKFNILKGEELNVEEEHNRLVVSTSKEVNLDSVEIDISNLSIMVKRCIHALYKRGVDEIRFTFSNPSFIKEIQKSLGKEAVGFEIIDHGKNHCIVKHVSGQFEDFDPILRRTFLLLMNMGEEILQSIKNKDFDHLPNHALMEETNNRFTSSCRRYLNRNAYKEMGKTGALYYIVEDLENHADEYKYLCKYLHEKRNEKGFKISKTTMQVIEETNNLLRTFYELFYKYDVEKVTKIAQMRKKQVERILEALEEAPTKYDRVALHHMFTVTQKIFNYVGPYLVMSLK